jgi:hypothetical protein
MKNLKIKSKKSGKKKTVKKINIKTEHKNPDEDYELESRKIEYGRFGVGYREY